MRTALKWLVGAAIVAAVVLVIVAQFAPPSNSLRPLTDDERALVDSGNRFAIALHGELAKDNSGNVFASPLGIRSALALAAHGANGRTREEFERVLRLPADRTRSLAAASLATRYSGLRGNCELDATNSVWALRNLGAHEAYRTDIGRVADGGFRELDFADRAAASREINAWIAERTRGRVAELIGPNDLGDATRLVLANAIAFRGRWRQAFTGETVDGTFHCLDGSRVAVPFMEAKGMQCRGWFGEDRVLLELPYRSGDLAMVVVMPRGKSTLAEIERSLMLDDLERWIRELGEPTEQDFFFPKFAMRKRLELRSALESLGLRSAFAPAADFTGIHRTEPLFVDRVLHQSFVEVDESGTEAAAATVVEMKKSEKLAPNFRFDRPFLFLIRDTKNGTILFLGRLANPLE